MRLGSPSRQALESHGAELEKPCTAAVAIELEPPWPSGLRRQKLLPTLGFLAHAPCWIRTNDRLLRRQLLYPAELRELG